MLGETDLENLDGMWADDLRDYAGRLESLRDLDEDDDRTRTLLAAYARHKSAAMDARAGGEILKALRLERWADDAYDLLPSYAKW